MKTRLMMLTACAGAVAIAIGGCGEAGNTITPKPGTTTHIKLELAGPANALYVGVYDAIALGYYKQSDMSLQITSPATGADPLTQLHHYQTQIAVSSEPNVLLRRNEDVPIVSVGAIVQKPLASVQVKLPKKKTKTKTTSGGKPSKKMTSGAKSQAAGKTTTTTTASSTHTLTDIYKPSAVGEAGTSASSDLLTPKQAIKLLERKDTPTYQGLVFVVRKGTIVDHGPIIRRFLQTAARGYRAARRDPQQAINNMIKLVPSLAGQKTELLATLKAFLPDMFPTIPTVGKQQGKKQPWGFQDETEWNQFGTWLHRHKLIEHPPAIADASTNELLAGKGV